MSKRKAFYSATVTASWEAASRQDKDIYRMGSLAWREAGYEWGKVPQDVRGQVDGWIERTAPPLTGSVWLSSLKTTVATSAPCALRLISEEEARTLSQHFREMTLYGNHKDFGAFPSCKKCGEPIDLTVYRADREYCSDSCKVSQCRETMLARLVTEQAADVQAEREGRPNVVERQSGNVGDTPLRHHPAREAESE